MFRSPLVDGIVVLLILLLIVGPKRLPMLSRAFGESVKEFKGGIGQGGADGSGEATPEISNETESGSKQPS